MNENKKVLVFTTVFTVILFVYSMLDAMFPSLPEQLKNISIISDVVTKKAVDSSALVTSQIVELKPPVAADTGLNTSSLVYERSFGLDPARRSITDFSNDTSHSALPRFAKKVHQFKKTKKGKVRIAWLGDSMIEGDLLTQTVRKKLQQWLGCTGGVGFVPATSVSAPFRATVNHTWTGTWTDENFKTPALAHAIFLSGHAFTSTDGVIKLKDQTTKDSSYILEKSLLCGPTAQPISITVNGVARTIAPKKLFNRIVLETSPSHSVNVGINNAALPVYGVSIEEENGVSIDNFSFRGITGIELQKLDTQFLKNIEQEAPYDLVVLEYGTNLLFRPEDTDYSWFQKHILPVFKRLRESMPNTDFLLISTSDRGFKYGETWQTAKGLPNLLKSQAYVAFTDNMAFYDLFHAMGGNGTIVKWAETMNPPLANKDYIHPNHKGAEILGSIVFDALVADVNKNEAYDQERENYNITATNTIVDIKNNLEWVIGDDKTYNWGDATNWLKSLGEKSGWALPTTEQLLTLFNNKLEAGQGYDSSGQRRKARMNSVFNKIGHSAFVWSAKEIGSLKSTAVNFAFGSTEVLSKETPIVPVRVMAVRKINSSQQP